jgi:3-dehydroquinate synthase
MRHLFLYGPPGSGKSTIGRLLAARLDLPFTDLDAVIVETDGRPIPQIFAEEGEPGFRAREKQALADMAARPRHVVALGGGALLNPECRALAEANGAVLCLACTLETLCQRIDNAPGSRPLAGNHAALEKLMANRAAHYASFSRRLDVTNGTPETLAEVAETLFGAWRIDSGDVPSLVFAGCNLIAGLGEEVTSLGLGRRAVVVCDSNTDPLYGERVETSLRAAGVEAFRTVIAAGESTKTLATVQSIWGAFLRAGLARDDFAVAVGGGVVGDLTGFAAATWMRGIRWVNVSTTLLSMVDASTGGKTGCDLPEAKNLVGAFHSPSLVLADVDTLASLPAREWRCGLAEAIKHAFIADPGLLDVLPTGTTGVTSVDLPAFVARALAVKVRCVREDPLEKGVRGKLNLGHTVGHAVEVASDFKIQHGEAVAIGTVEEARLAVRLGLAPADWPDRVAAPFACVGLPTALPEGCTFESLVPVMKRDKKKKGGVVRFALPCAPGDVRLTPVDL